jgi:hypothetical protein
MKERIWLSAQEYNYGKDVNLKVSNASKVRGSIESKTTRSLQTCMTVLEMTNIDNETKRKLFSLWDLERFTSQLIAPNSATDSFEEYNYKLSMARQFIKSGLAVYRSKFKKTKLVESKLKDFEDTLETLNEIANEYENTLDPKFQQFKQRMKMRKSPINLSVPNSAWWQALCVYCLNSSSGKSKELAVKKLNHEKFCTYKKKEMDYFLVIMKPEKKTRERKSK